MKIKRFNEDYTADNPFELAKEFVCEYVKNGSEMTMPEYFEFYFNELRGVRNELIKDIKAICSNLYLDSKKL